MGFGVSVCVCLTFVKYFFLVGRRGHNFVGRGRGLPGAGIFFFIHQSQPTPSPNTLPSAHMASGSCHVVKRHCRKLSGSAKAKRSCEHKTGGNGTRVSSHLRPKGCQLSQTSGMRTGFKRLKASPSGDKRKRAASPASQRKRSRTDNPRGQKRSRESHIDTAAIRTDRRQPKKNRRYED